MWKWKETKVKGLLQKRDFFVKWVNFSIWFVHFENFISIASSNIIFNGKSWTSSQSPPHLSADMPNVEPAQVHAPLPISILLLIAMTDERKGHKFFCFHSLVENWRMARRKKAIHAPIKNMDTCLFGFLQLNEGKWISHISGI